MSPNISHHFQTNNGCFVICLPIYIYIYFHVMTDVYSRELLKSTIPLFNWTEKQYLYTCALRIVKE